MFYHGGYFCKTYNKSRDKNICTRENSPIERFEDQGNISIIEPISSIYDFIGPHGTQEEKEKYQQAIIDYTRDLELNLTEKCKDYKNLPYQDIPVDIGTLTMDLYKQIFQYKYELFNNIWHNYHRALAQGETEFNEYMRESLIRHQRDLNLFFSIKDDPRLDPNNIPYEITPQNYTPTFSQGEKADNVRLELSPRFGTIYKQYLNQLTEMRNMPSSEERKTAMDDLFVKNELFEELDKYSKKRFKDLVINNAYYYISYDDSVFDRERCEDIMIVSQSRYEGVREIYEQSYQLCVSDDFINKQSVLIRALYNINSTAANLGSDMENIISKFDDDMRLYLMKIINEDCINEVPGSFIEMSELNLSCKNIPWNYNNQKQLTKAKKALNKKVDKHLRKNKTPLALSICTGFFKDQTANSNFGEICDKTKRHGNHGVLIIGSRCRNNKIEYQIQNSWGNSCSPYIPPGESESIYDCNPNEGNLWVPEDILVPNTYHVDVLE